MTASAATFPHALKRRREVVTPEGIALPFHVASRSSRAGALMLDMFFLLVIGIGVTILLSYVSAGIGSEPGGDQTSGANEFVIVLWTLFWFFLWNGYFMVMEMGPRGATFGKRLTGIRVASRDGGRLTAEAILARNLIRDIELFLPLLLLLIGSIMSIADEDFGWSMWAATGWFLVFMLFPFFNRDALRAGDVIAGTWVVEAPRTKLAAALSTEGAAREGSSEITGAKYQFSDEELSVYGEYELQTLERVLRDDRQEAMAAVHEAICRKISWDPGAGDERAFLEAFYAQLRARLEGGMRFGKRKKDKFDGSA